MNNAPRLLPPGYEALEPFAADWAISSFAERSRRRDESTPEERQAFYHATRGIAVQALADLDTKPLDQFNEQERRLLALLLSYALVALTIEIRLDGEAAHVRDRQHMVITRERTRCPPIN